MIRRRHVLPSVGRAEISPEVRRMVEATLPHMGGGAAGLAAPSFRSIVSGQSPWDGGFFAAVIPERPRFVAGLPLRIGRGRAA